MPQTHNERRRGGGGPGGVAAPPPAKTTSGSKQTRIPSAKIPRFLSERTNTVHMYILGVQVGEGLTIHDPGPLFFSGKGRILAPRCG
jgi:hypothetical protein